MFCLNCFGGRSEVVVVLFLLLFLHELFGLNKSFIFVKPTIA